MAVIILFVLGLILGSFVNALVWRVRKRKNILNGRSQCPHCGHQLAPRDLIPVASWLQLGGKCRYCGKSISRQYPAVELTAAFVFALSYVFWPHGLHDGGQWLLLATWLLTFIGLLALLIYDIRWMLLPNKILYPTLWIAAAGRLVYVIGFAGNKGYTLEQWFLAVIVSSGIFWVLFMVSEGRWIGYGDVRLGLIVGTVLGELSKSLLAIVLSSFIGTLLAIPMLSSGKKNWGSKVPYGPFLIIATVISLLFGSGIIDWYKSLSGH